MEQKIQAAQGLIDQLNAHLTEQPYKLALVDPKDVDLIDKNARYMEYETFNQLVKNIEHDGGLTSMPLCHKDPKTGKLTALSGNHRVKAARSAGIAEIMVMYIEKPLTKGHKVAIQLSHNAIVGKDDMVILKSLWGEIEEIELKLYAGLDSELLKELEEIEYTTIAEAHMDFRTITIAFLPEEAAALGEALQLADVLFSGDENYLVSRSHYEQVFAAVADVKEKFNIVNNPTAFMKIVELARERMGEENNLPCPHPG